MSIIKKKHILSFIMCISICMISLSNANIEAYANNEVPAIAELEETEYDGPIHRVIHKLDYDEYDCPEPKLTTKEIIESVKKQYSFEKDTADDSLSLEIPADGTAFKTFMGYDKITCEKSKQYQLQHDGHAWTDELGFRVYDGYYMVALGTYYTGYECGKKFRITFESGTEINVITGDVKSDVDTDNLHQHKEGNVIEFIVDTELIPEVCKISGDMSKAKGRNLIGKVVKIEKIL